METGEVVAIVVALVISVAVAAIVMVKLFLPVWAGRPKKKLARIDMVQGRWFELAYVLESQQPHKVFLSYHLHSKGTGGSVEYGFSSMAGMLVHYECSIGGEQVKTETLGKGGNFQSAPDRLVKVGYFSRTSSNAGDFSQSATMPLFGVSPRPAGTEILIRAKVEPNQFTDCSTLLLFVSS